jgi:hypothetical protein
VDLAFQAGVAESRKIYGVPHPDSREFDLVIADVYPFDASFAFTRKGWWPVMHVAQNCHKLIISAMPKGVGGHLVFPIPNDRKINKLVRLYYELVTFGIRHFIRRSLASRFRKLFRRLGYGRSKPQSAPGSKPAGKSALIRSELPGTNVVYLHHAAGKAALSLRRLPYRIFLSPEKYIKYITEATGNKPLRVALYKASSLTFPE